MQKVLLARPSPFIVDSMKEFLKQVSFASDPISTINDLVSRNLNEYRAAIISTAVNSPIQESYADVYAILREKAPDLPIIFATLGNVDNMSQYIVRTVEAVTGGKAELIRADRPREAGEAPEKVFLIHKENIETPEAREETAEALSHFLSLRKKVSG